MKKIKNGLLSIVKKFTWWELVFIFVAEVTFVVLGIVFDASALVILNAMFIILGVCFLTKGLTFGYFISIVQCVLYSCMSINNRFYGELLLCVCVSIPIYVVAIFNWLRKTEKSVVIIREKVSVHDWGRSLIVVSLLTLCASIVMWMFDTNFLVLSILSVFTSILAAYLQAMRSELGFILYFVNGIIVAVMWALQISNAENIQYVVTIVQIFFSLQINVYGYLNWCKLKKEQSEEKSFQLIMKTIKCRQIG